MAYENKLQNTSRVIWGTLLLLIGTALLLDNLNVLELGPVWRHWPFIPIAIGIGKLLGAQNRKDYGEGAWWVFIGAWLYISVFEVYGLGFRESWPLLLIGWGITMVWKSLEGNTRRSRTTEQRYTIDTDVRSSKGESA